MAIDTCCIYCGYLLLQAGCFSSTTMDVMCLPLWMSLVSADSGLNRFLMALLCHVQITVA